MEDCCKKSSFIARRSFKGSTNSGAAMFILLNKYYSGDHVKEFELGGSCYKRGGEEKCMLSFVGRSERYTVWKI
jgi:hypothetical protein